MPNNSTTPSNTFKFKENPFHTEGLTTAQVHNSRKQHGYNELPKPYIDQSEFKENHFRGSF
jgi:Cation transporter/ATPase, N-terminus